MLVVFVHISRKNNHESSVILLAIFSKKWEKSNYYRDIIVQKNLKLCQNITKKSWEYPQIDTKKIFFW